MNTYHEAHRLDPGYKARNAERARLWYNQNREKALARVKTRAMGLKPEKAAYDELYYQENKSRRKDYYGRWYAENKDKAVDNVRRWRKANPIERRLQNQARRAKTNGIKISKEEIFNWGTRICGICDKLIEDKFDIDHIMPLSRGGKHDVTNLQLAHPICNRIKGTNLPSL